MLTVDYERLGLQRGELVLDLGAGAGRHAFESLRRGARIIALDASYRELTSVRDLFWAMREEGEAGDGGAALPIQGDALALPFADRTFDRIIASEVLEHISDDDGAIVELMRVLKPGGTIAVTVPAWLPEKLCWWLSAEYHAPLAEGGHVRIYTTDQLRQKLINHGALILGSHRAHALHSPYWWLRCAVGPTNDQHPLVRGYHRLLVWDIAKAPRLTRTTERLLNPVLGKSVVIYATKASESPRVSEEVAHVAA